MNMDLFTNLFIICQNSQSTLYIYGQISGFLMKITPSPVLGYKV